MRKEYVDVLVVGGGGAGLRAALAAHEAASSLRIVLATKGKLGRSGLTATARSDRMAFHATLPYTEPSGEDNWRYHAEDIYRLGGCVSDGRLAELHAKRSAEAFEYLERLGVPWARLPDGKAEQFLTDGSRYARACHVGPDTAIEIERALLAELRRTGLQSWEDTALVKIFQEGGHILGVLLVTGDEPVLVHARSVVLATGGPGRIFASTVYPPEMTAEAAAAALDAGAEFVNLEFIQMGLCSRRTALAFSGSLLRAAPRVIDSRGRDILEAIPGSAASKWLLTFEKGASWPVSFESPYRDFDITCAVARRSGPIFLDYTRDPEGFDVGEFLRRIERWPLEAESLRRAGREALGSPVKRLSVINPRVFEWLRAHGDDPGRAGGIEVVHCVQHFQGGVKIGPDASTSLAGLYACGEAAGGQHGAGRPGGNSLLDCQVFGRIAGESAASNALAAQDPPAAHDLERHAIAWVELMSSFPAESLERAAEAAAHLCDRACGVIRTEDTLRSTLEELRQLRRSLHPHEGVKAANLLRAAEVIGGLTMAEVLMECALARRESRGSHMRFEGKAPPFQPIPQGESIPNWIIAKKEGDRLILRPEVPPGLFSG